MEKIRASFGCVPVILMLKKPKQKGLKFMGHMISVISSFLPPPTPPIPKSCMLLCKLNLTTFLGYIDDYKLAGLFSCIGVATQFSGCCLYAHITNSAISALLWLSFLAPWPLETLYPCPNHI